MATNIRRRGKSWCVVYRRHGRQHWRSFPTRAEAELYPAQANLRRAQGQPEPGTGLMKLSELAAEWLGYKRGRVGEQMLLNYANVLGTHLLPTLGSLDIRRELSRKVLDDFVSDWLNGGPRFRERVRLAQGRERERARRQGREPRPVRVGRSPKTIGNAIVVASSMLGWAVDHGYLVANPAARLERPRDERPFDSTMQVLDAAGLRALVDAAPDEAAHTLLLTAAMTGMRRGEVLALRWRDVDYTNGRVWVRRSVGLGGVIKAPKSRKSVRSIALPNMLADELETHWKRSRFREADDLVFPSTTGTPLDGRNMIRTVFEPARKRAGLGRLRFHDLRHSYASVLIAQGVHPKVISEQLGHASVAITMDRYSHLFDRAYIDVSAELEAAWNGAPASPTRQETRGSETALLQAGLQADRPPTAATAFHSDDPDPSVVPAQEPV